MFKWLIKNPKRVVRNFTIIFLGYILALAILGSLAYFIKDKLENVPLYITVIVTGVGSLGITITVVAFIGQFANKRDSELRRRFKSEVNNLDNSTLALANGVTKQEIINTTRNAKEIKKELVDLQIELYHAQERDKNLKLSKKF
ncbi:hypothetical protein [Spiroplasma endosymbiont of Diplazon laetatorius]|uniref:hypothetical protein n=1 Tax=Spiroplasma endosymbiont of Diplazon laetatorius TaxID=3066322 RepID=UPI0030D02AB7